MLKCVRLLLAAVSCWLVVTCSADGHGEETLTCPDSWFLGSDKCYRIFYGENKLAYDRAREVCKSYGSRLVTFKDQYENDLVGEKVEEMAGAGEAYYIGLSREADDNCVSCPDLKWSSGEMASEYEGFWSDSEPDDSDGGCVFARKNDEDYCYDRPYAWSFCNCLIKRSFVCERMAAPEDTFHCHSGGYINNIHKCNASINCEDGSDELDCSTGSNCRYYHRLPSGDNAALGQLFYRDAWTCTWAIETPVGTNAYVQLNNFNTEFQADYVTVYAGNVIETMATRIDRISGDLGTKVYRSHNNMMILKFTSDSSVSNTGRMTGFTGIYGALQASGQISLIAENIPRTYSLTTLDVANTNTFLGQNDYFILIETQNQYQLGPMITLEILSSQLNDEDMIILYDGATPADPQLSTYCNDDSDCNNYPVVYSTGRTMSVLIRTGKTVTNNVGLTFRYRQGCHYETTEKWGTLFTPGFPSNINYPNMVTCTWTINVDEPVALYFDPTSRLQDASYNRDENGDYLKMYDNGTMFPSSQAQLTTSDIAGKVFRPTTGKIRLELETTSTRSAKGFLATWSPACENPNYDDGYTTISTPEPVWHYMSSMTVSCKSGYEFRQEQTQTSDLPTFMSQVTVECGFKGIWKNYLQIPKCLPKYCGPVPNIANGIIQSSTSVVFEGTATYKCNAGSVSNTGSLEITCQANGNWSPTPICIAATCTPGVIFTSITNGNGELIVGDGTSIGTVYQFTCNPGFEIDGEPFVFCQEDGSWTQNSSPTCQRLTCLLPEIENGFYSGSNSAGGFISFSSNPASVSCDNGFKFADNSPTSVSCSADRTVSELPQCIDRDECENANICDGTCHNTVGSFYCSCDSGFTLAQDQSSCLDVHECNLDIDNCDGGCQNLIGSYSCSCSAPYVLYTEDMTSGFAIPTAAGERGDLSTDTYYIDHSCVLVNCSKPEVTINNGQILTKRDIHRYGDHVEYQCDRGYTPARTVITCDRNGNWVGAPPTCQAVTCTDTTGFLRNSPTYTPGPYALDERLTLQCDVAGRQFEKYRFCTYNNALGTYEMQGSPYECGVVDCGQPQQSPGSNYGTVSNTLFNATFEFTCGSNARLGTSGDGSISTVRCLAEGYWDFGSLRCTGQSCLDPGYPAGGSIIASSLGDKSTVTFDCDRSGYTLTSDVTLTCQGTSFVPGGLNIPTCIDTENPVISGCPTSPIVINKYELLQPRLPQLTVSDNTGIASSTIEPRNANSTLYVSANLVVTYRVTDHAGNSATCQVSVQLADETPPNIQCPSVRTVELQNDSDIEQYTKLTVADVVTFGNIASIKDFSVTGEPTSITVQDLFSTITYTVSVTDQSNNPASCRGQIFIRPRPCSDLDYSTPLNADKTCTDVPFSGTRQCVLTCRDSYTFEDSKTKTIQCSNGVWDTPRIPACVLDVTLPVVICPSSRQINNLAARSDQHEVDFSLLANSVTSTDLNTLNEPDFSPQKYTFTPADLYRPKLIQVSVTDVAGNTGTCNFQYTAIPPICSELSVPVPQFGSVQCSRRVGTTIRDGWDCTITCETGKILRNHGFTKSVNCDDGFAWSDSDIFPACVDDTKAPVISCPTSRVEYLYTGNDFRTIDFSGSTGSSYTHTETDFSGIQSVSFNPPTLQISTAFLNSARPVTMTVRDNANNQASCSFQVLIRANDCSPLALEPPVNGDRSCSTTTNGYSCVITCNPGHSFVSTVASSITTTCSNGGTFTEYIPDCVDDSDTENKQYIATLQYEYVPDDRTVPSVDNACISNYIDKVTERSATNVFDSILDEMGGRLEGSCESTFGPFPSGFLNITFFPLSTTGRVISDGFNLRVVQMEYQYTVLFAPDPTMDTRCTDAFKSQIQSALNTFPLSQNIAGDGTCPPLQWNNVSRVIDENEYCILPYFQSLTDTEICSRCPAGTQSNGNTCNICSVGFYATVNGALCEQCPLGYTTPHPGAVSINKCIAPCGFGQISGTGYSPCYLCPVGSYKINNQQCQTCGIGETTAGAGSATPDACVDSTSLYDEPCSVGTQDVGNRVCELCSVGTYRSANVQTCVSCPSPQTTTYFKGSRTSADCYGKCSNGFVSSTGMVPCTPCPVGRYFVNETTCLDCPTDFTTVTTGSTVCVRLTDLLLNCPKGTSRDINTGQCTLCAEGTFNAFEEANCVDCGNDGSTYNPGATSRSMCQAKCPPGFFSSTGLSPCFPCGVGNYSVVPGSNACTACSPNNDMTTATTTSTSASQCIAQCSAGQFSDSGYNLNGACRQCPRHHYQQQSGQTTCTQCSANSGFSTGTGLTDFSQCLELASQCDGKCQNGNCALRNNEAVCDCPLGQYYGPNCAIAVNHCLSQPCYNNGACSSTPLGYTCNCVGTGATGIRCETVTPTCDTSQNTPTCANGGHCLNKPNGPECLCVDGFGGPRCTTRTNICAMDTCDPVGTRECRDVSLGSNLRRYCDCHPGYTGETCSEDIDECASDPCINGGACQNLLNSFRCDCLPGYSGTFCQTRADRCQLQFYNCRQYDSLASCVDVYSKDQPTCICNPGHAYDGNGFTQYQIAINTAPSNLDIWDYSMDITIADCRDRCTSQTTNCNRFAFDNLNSRCYLWSPGVQLNLIFNANVYMYTKSVIYPEDDFYSPRYNINPIDPFNPDAERLSTYRGTYGLDICGGTEPLSARCCRAGTTCLHNEGLPSGTQCTSEGLTTDDLSADYTIQFKCSVNRVFQRNDCRQKTDYCGLDTCKNGGICNSIFGGYVCNCQNGYTGRNCQTNIDDCAGNPCSNGGTCEDQVGFYTCKCTSAYEGPNCNSPKNFCSTQNCNGNGLCRNIEGVGFECTCNNGYEGVLCEDEVDKCGSNPCQHGGQCSKLFNDYVCGCVPGWTGKDCENAVQHCLISQSGGQCVGNCYNIFNSYYCECEANAFGTNCENKPNPCRDYDKCQNNAVCSYNTSMSCMCPTKYTGDGCEILRDFCGKENPCENDATCLVTDTGYQCQCKPGYNGMRCENEIDECNTATCPVNGQCYDAINKYYCRCPIRYTGTDCGKVFDRNYDLYFGLPKGCGFAWIPYFIPVETADYLSISLWVRYSNNDDTGVYLTQFIGDKLEDASTFLELNEQGVRVYVQNGNDPFIQLTYDRQAKVNDGNWHLVTVLCDMVNGEIKHYLDSIKHDSQVAPALVMPASTFRMWVVLGCEFDNVEQKCLEGGRGFNGYLSQVNFYKRELTFERSITDIEGDIPKNFRLPQHIFDSNIEDLILVWNEYEFESCVNRMIPSEANGVACSDITRSPACSSYRTTALPYVTGCPEDMVVTTQDRVVTVAWDEPTFHNVGVQSRVVKPNRLPGSIFTWGVYRNTYIGIDGNNNKAFCHFTLHVTAGQCDTPPDPRGGSQTCNNVADRQGCMISCNNVNQNTYMIDREHPDLFTCGPSGWWNADKPFRRCRYPSCGLAMATPKQRIFIHVSYRVGTSAYTAAKRNAEVRTYEELIKLKEIFDGDFCQAADCSDVDVVVSRGSTNIALESVLLLDITLSSVSARTTLDGEEISAVEFLTYFILGGNILIFETIPDFEFQKEDFTIEGREICPMGQVVLNGLCVECGPGNYFRYTDSTNTTAICDDCGFGTYQDQSGASTCKSCGSGETTEMTGEYQQSSCKKICSTGQYFNSIIQDCAECAEGYYQDEVGQFRCKGCPAGYTTKDMGAISSVECSVSCESGYELNNDGLCDPCPIGQYRNATQTRTCVPCGSGTITLNVASKSRDDCNIVECSAGSYRDVATNLCKACPLNQYQPNKWQTRCISCGDASRWRTEDVGSDSQSKCLYFCPSGYEAKQDPTNQCNICPIGFYKNNNDDIQGPCRECPNNRRTENNGSTSAADCTIYKCPVGYKPNSLNTDCVVCPEGQYQDVEFSTDCKQCQNGYSTRQNASTSGSQCERFCPSGQEKIGELCLPCKLGSYKNNLDGLFKECEQCDEDFTTLTTGSDDELDCNIRTCPPGTKRNADDSGCEDCPLGSYQPIAYQKDCIPCTSGTSTRNTKSTSADQCETYCESGFEEIDSGCVACEIGYTKNNVDDGYFAPCKMCPIDYITAGIKSTSEAQCTVGNCSAGQYLKPDKTCGLCEKGTFQPDKWQSECIDCGLDKTTENVGSDEQSDCILECQPGFEDIGGVCSPCRRGYYKIETAAALCRQCRTGFTTETTGANSPALCVLPACEVGTYLDKETDPDNPLCVPCGYDTYQDEIWQEECKSCLNNRVTLQIGADESTDCVLDCASGLQYDVDEQKCVFCGIGYYRNRDDRQRPQCQLCPLDTITAGEGSIDRTKCEIANCTTWGYYRDVDTNTCKECPLGKYNSIPWQTSCTDCPLGNSTKSTGAAFITDCISVCPLGQFVGTNNNCQLCARGTYRSDVAADTCTDCPNRLITPGLGADSENDCSISPCAAGQQYALNSLQCTDCPVGTYQPNSGSFQCIECPFAIKFTPREGAVSADECRSPCGAGEQFDAGSAGCVPCPSGTYQPTTLQFSCLQCPEGRKYTSQTGTTRIEDCLSYCSVSDANDCSVNASCSISTTSAQGYTCSCFSNYDSIGASNGRVCLHKCDRGYCENDATCTREPTVRCACSKWYRGDRCEIRIKAEDLSDDTLDIVIPVSIAAGGLILFLIILAVCCLCWRRAHPMQTPAQQYSEFNGDRIDKASLHSHTYGAPYGSRPPSRLMLAPGPEMHYDNQLYSGKDHAAVYEA